MATTQIKRAIRKGEQLAGRLLGDSSHKDHGSYSSCADRDVAAVESESIVSNYTQLIDGESDSFLSEIDAQGISILRCDSQMNVASTSELNLAKVSMIVILCAGLFHAIELGDDTSFVDIQVPLYVLILAVGLSFLLGRFFEVIFGSKSRYAVQQSTPKDNFSSVKEDVGMDGGNQTNETVPRHNSHYRQYAEGVLYAKHLIHKIHNGKRKVKEYTNNLSPRNRTDKFFSNLPLHDLEDKLKHSIHLSNDLMRHLLTYQDFSTSAAPATHGPQSINCAAEAAIADSTIGHAILNHSHDSTFEEEGLDHIVDPLCSLRGMDLFLGDNPEQEIWRQPILTE